MFSAPGEDGPRPYVAHFVWGLLQDVEGQCTPGQ
jgi:hypothetical protein